MVRSDLDVEDYRVKDRDSDDDREDRRDREKGRDREKERTKEKEKAKDRDRDKEKAREREKERDKEKERLRDKDREKERERDRDRDKDRERDREKERDKDKDRVKERDRERRDREKDRERVRESSKDLEKEKERNKEKIGDGDSRGRDSSKHKDRERDDRRKERVKDRGDSEKKDADKVNDRKKDKREGDVDKAKEKEKDREREREKEKEREKDRDRDKDRERDKDRDREKGRDKEKNKDIEVEVDRYKDRDAESKGVDRDYDKEMDLEKQRDPVAELGLERISEDFDEIKTKEKLSLNNSRKGKSDTGGEIASWVSRSRSLEERKRIEERIKAARMARLLSEQESGEESEDEDKPGYSGKDLAGLKVLHGIDKVMEGGAVVLTLKDKGILDGDDLNPDVDELENIEIAQQQSRDQAYQSAKKKPGIYEDKFQNDINAVRTILPQYDEEMQDTGMTLDDTGGIDEEGRKRLEELKKKLQGDQRPAESLAGSGTIASDFYTHDEMLQFNKPKKKKKLRKKAVLDLDTLEAEAKAEGLGESDLGSRSSDGRQALKLEKEKADEESRKSAYMNAYTKAVDASQKLRLGNVADAGAEETAVFGVEEDDELEKSLQRSRQAALKRQSENGGVSTGPQAVVSTLQKSSENSVNQMGYPDDGVVVFTETEEFCRSLQLDEVLMRRPGAKDAFGEDEEPAEEEELVGMDGGWMEVNEGNEEQELEEQEGEEDMNLEEAVVEVSVGKGLAGALQLLKERGTLKETVEWGGRTMDKKKSKLVGILDQNEKFKNREILLDRVDEFGRIMTPKESFRKLSHKFHGKGPGKMKQEKRMKQYAEEMKLKQMSSGDTPLLSMEKMRDAQAKLHTPYIVISGHIKPGQTSDPRSGFATMEKESIGSLTPMLGDKKVEHFLGIKRKPDGGSMKPPLPKKPKPGP